LKKINKIKSKFDGRFKETWDYVIPYFKQYKSRLILVIVLSLFASLFEPGIAYLVKPTMNYLFDEPELGKELLWLIPFSIIAAFTYRGVLTFSYKYILERLCLRVVRDIKTALYEHFMFLSMYHYQRTSTGEMMSRTVTDVGHMHRIVPNAVDSLHQGFQLIGLTAVCFYMEPVLSLLAFISFPPTIYAVQMVSTRMRRYTKKGLVQSAEINSLMQETYAGSQVVKAFAMEDQEVKRYRKAVNKLLRIQFKYAAVKHLISPLLGIIASLPVGIIAYFAAARVIDQVMNNPDAIENLSSYIVAVGLMFNPVRKLGSITGHFSSAYGAAQRIQETFEKQTTVTEEPNAIDLPLMQDSIRYENVSFHYEDEMVVKDFNLEAKKGQLVALVGVSGSGKSTIVNLLPRFYDPTEGSIKIDGVDIRKATLKSLRLQIGVVTQETFLFNDTVANNIKYGAGQKCDKEVEEVAKAALAHDFISRLPQGYNSVIGERGVRLSGGERQRIAIARALMKDPPILILDEATSALDTAAEREVQKALEQLMKNRTTLAIAHRLSTITHADKIVVIQNGSIVEWGTHRELMRKGGEYKRLYEMQFFLGEYATDHYGDGDEGGTTNSES